MVCVCTVTKLWMTVAVPVQQIKLGDGRSATEKVVVVVVVVVVGGGLRIRAE